MLNRSKLVADLSQCRRRSIRAVTGHRPAVRSAVGVVLTTEDLIDQAFRPNVLHAQLKFRDGNEQVF